MVNKVGPYEIRGLLGQGGIGRVHIGVDTDLGREVAIKSLRPELTDDPSFVERFRAEATSLAKLNHPNITTLFALVTEGGSLHMVMEVVRGATLESILARRGGRIDPATAIELVAQAGEGLAYAHKMGVIHRDIKPANIMVTDSGLLKLMDFGIARIQGGQRLTRDGSIVGTLAYMAPEQLKGAEGDQRSDLYSLACVFYEMLTGSPPFKGDTDYELMQAQINQAPSKPGRSVPDLSPQAEAAILKALEKSPDKRFATVRDFVDAIDGKAGSTSARLIVPLSTLLKEPGSTAGATTEIADRSTRWRRWFVGIPLLARGVLVGAFAATLSVGAWIGWTEFGTTQPDRASQRRAQLTEEPAPGGEGPRSAARNPMFPDMNGGGRAVAGAASSDERAARVAGVETASAIKATADVPSTRTAPPLSGDFADAEIAYRDADYRRALSIALPLAQQEDAEAQFMVGKLYEFGRGGIETNLSEAFRWYRRAAVKGNAKAQYRTGAFYHQGLGGIPVDLQKAVEWYGRGSEGGDMDAAYFLAVMTYKGEGMARPDPKRAAELFSRVSQSRSPRAREAAKNVEAILAARPN